MPDIRRLVTYANGTKCHAEAMCSFGKRFINFTISGTETTDELKEMALREAKACEMEWAVLNG